MNFLNAFQIVIGIIFFLSFFSSTLFASDDFFVGVNYAWTSNINDRGDSGFAVDFGGLPRDDKPGISQRKDQIRQDFKTMSASGITVVRWWVFPKFFGDGVQFDDEQQVVGLGGTIFKDIEVALDVAAEFKIQIMFCFFSFDNFLYKENYPRLSTIIRDQQQRNIMVNKVVRPFVEFTYEYMDQKGYSDLIHSWDIINEPEWAIQRRHPGIRKSTDFEPCLPYDYIEQSTNQPYNYCYGRRNEKATDAITLEEMERFIKEVTWKIKWIRPKALVQFGMASSKWAFLWSMSLKQELDFYQIHFYEWVDSYLYPYDTPINEQIGLEDKSVIIGEYPAIVNKTQHLDLLRAWHRLGYKGAMAWHYTKINDVIAPEWDHYDLNQYLNETRQFLEEIGNITQPPETILVFKYAGVEPCGKDDTFSLSKTAKNLRGIRIFEQFKKTVYCGPVAGRGNFFRILADDWPKAQSRGFQQYDE